MSETTATNPVAMWLTGGARGTGRTSYQMRHAPTNAAFVWCNGHLRYPKCLAKHLDREDLKVISPEQYRAGHSRGLRAIVLDHAVDMMEIPV